MIRQDKTVVQFDSQPEPSKSPPLKDTSWRYICLALLCASAIGAYRVRR